MKESDKNKKEMAVLEDSQQQIAFEVEDYLKKNYLLRYNMMTRMEECCKITSENDEKTRQNAVWQPLSDRLLNTIVHEKMRMGGNSWAVDIRRFIHSTLIPEYNPMQEYLQNLPPCNRHYDYIGSMARRIPTNFAHAETLFHRWFLAMVAQWLGMNRNHGNAVVLMLIGNQGQFKSTFCKLILPPCLREYYIDDIKMESSEQVERMLCRMALVNIDEYNAKTNHEQARIKRILTEREIQVRQMRSSKYAMLNRMASFTATTNDQHPLSDPSGSRRYLCIPVKGRIQTARAVLHDKMYAQAMYELQQGERYWFDRREEALLNENNRQFQQIQTVDELLLSFYKPALRSVRYFVRAIDIQKKMRSVLAGRDIPSLKMLTMALARNKFQHGAYNGKYGWYVQEVG